MNLPRKFTGLYGQNLQNPVTLTTPNGTEWQMYLTRDQSGQLSLTGGWTAFRVHYKLGWGSFILFCFDGSSTFRVKIHDLTTCEISYSIFDVINLDDENAHGVGPSSLNKAPTTAAAYQCLFIPTSPKEKHVVQNFTTDNIYFAIDITVANVSSRMQANVPKLPTIDKKEHNVLLHHATTTWPLKFKQYWNKKTGCLFAGWSNFATHCNLKPGDVCVLELTADNPVTFEVHVF